VRTSVSMYAVFHLHVLASTCLECALNLRVLPVLPLRRHGSTCFGESSNLPTVTDDHSIGAQGVAKCGRVAT